MIARRCLHHAGRFFAALAIVAAHSAAQAQSTHDACPDAGVGATAAEQAVCWFDRHEASDSTCTIEGVDVCLTNATGWCHGVPLDDPRVREACFLAPLRAGRFTQAAEVAEYLSDASPSVARCRDAVTGMLSGRVVSNPAGGEVTVDGRSYGPAPLEVQLPSPWWEREIIVRFGDTPVTVTAEAIGQAFDSRSCRLGDIVVEGPRSTGSGAPTGGGGDDALGIAGWVLVGVGAAAGVTALITGIAAESTYQDLATRCPAGPCGPGLESDISSGAALALTSTVTTFIGAGLGVAGIVLLIIDVLDAGSESADQQARITPGPSPLGLGVEVGF